ncbi:MAG TPA: tetratricopeptide repeat protein [Candidatus Aquicultor sp.]|jgi:tetratricopeptide (TPR) repeat protein
MQHVPIKNIIVCLFLLLLSLAVLSCASNLKNVATSSKSKGRTTSATVKDQQTAKQRAETIKKRNAIKSQQKALQQALEKNPRDVSALIGMGDSYFDLVNLENNKGHYNKAIVYYKQALVIDPTNANVRTDMAVSYFKLGQNGVAKEELAKVIHMDNRNYRAYYNLGLMLSQEGNIGSTVQCFQKVVELAPKESRFTIHAKAYLKKVDEWLKSHTDQKKRQAVPSFPVS